MSNKENLPLITTRNKIPDDERSIVTKEKDTASISHAVDGMMDLTRIENGKLNQIDLESMMNKTENMVLEKKRC